MTPAGMSVSLVGGFFKVLFVLGNAHKEGSPLVVVFYRKQKGARASALVRTLSHCRRATLR